MKNPADIIKSNPESVLFARYASTLAKEGKIDEALEILNTGINAHPFYAPGYSVLAEINKGQYLHEAAVEHYEKALELDPQSPRDLLALGGYLKKTNPSLAKKIFLRAGRFEPDVPDIHDVLSDIGTEEESADLGLSPDTEKALTDLAEEPAEPEEVDEIGDDFAELLADAEPSLHEEDELPEQPAEEITSEETQIMDQIAEGIEAEQTLVEQPAEDTGVEETKMQESPAEAEPSDEAAADIEPEEEETAGSDIREAETIVEENIVTAPPEPDVVDIPSDTETAEASPEEDLFEGEEVTKTEAEEIAALFGDREEPDHIDEGLMPPEEETAGIHAAETTELPEVDEINEDTEHPPEPEADEEEPHAQAVAVEDEPAEENLQAEEQQVSDEEDYDLSSLYGGNMMGNGADMEELVGPPEDIDMLGKTDTTPDETDEDIDNDSLPDYADILEDSTETAAQGSDEDASEYGVLDIEDMGENSYDSASSAYDLTPELEEPVISDEERAELMAFEQEPEQPEDNRDEGSLDIEAPEDLRESDDTSDTVPDSEEPSGNENGSTLYGDLSSDELEILSAADAESADSETDLDDETRDGIDYSDILYGHEEIGDTKNPLVTDEIPSQGIQEESDASGLPLSGDLSMLKQSLDINDSNETDAAPSDEINLDEFTGSYSGNDLIKESTEEPENQDVSAYDLSLDAHDIDEVDHTSLEDLIDNYVGALKGPHEDDVQKDVPMEDAENVESVKLDFAGDIDITETAGDSTDTDQMTATMAEIYVKQGLISSAIDIYQNLQQKAPQDEKITSRLEELRQMKQEESEEE